MDVQQTQKTRVFFFTDREKFIFESRDASRAAFDPIVSRNYKTLVADVKRFIPKALVVDMEYCKRATLNVRPLLEHVKHEMQKLPVYLFKADVSECSDLVSRGIVYSVSPEIPTLSKLKTSVDRYYAIMQATRDNQLPRQEVAVACLLKRVGSSGVVNGLVVNMTQKGMKVTAEAKLEEWTADAQLDKWVAGDDIRFSLLGHGHDHILGTASLRWIHSPTQASQSWNLGLMLTDIPKEVQKQIVEIIVEATMN